MARRLKKWRELNPYGLSELVYLAHNGGSDVLLQCFASEVGIYEGSSLFQMGELASTSPAMR